MSLPPVKIKIKRKLGEDEPVNYLRIDGSKRQQSGAWYYQRKAPDVESAEGIPRPLQELPVIHSSGTANENTRVAPSANTSAAGSATAAAPGNGASPAGTEHKAVARPVRAAELAPEAAPAPALTSSSGNETKQHEPRRFHLSRAVLADAGSLSEPAVVTKRQRDAAVFVERRNKKKRLRNTGYEGAKSSRGDPDKNVGETQTPAATSISGTDAAMVEAERAQLKRPGQRSRIVKKEGPEARQLPPSLLNRRSVDMDQVAKDMEAYTLEQIGRDLARMKEEDERQAAPVRIVNSRFKPKAPARRYAERHPDQVVQEDVNMESHDESESEDEGYVVETYYRVPAHAVDTASVRVEEVGVLVLDNDPDVQFFYGQEDDSEEEWAEDDEDENREDYYTADYPEDEVASDDEYGRDPYHFRNGNASDLEEYDRNDADQIYTSDPDEDGVDDGARNFRSYVRQQARPFNN